MYMLNILNILPHESTKQCDKIPPHNGGPDTRQIYYDILLSVYSALIRPYIKYSHQLLA